MMQHDWIPSTLGHGETMCSACFVTNREAAALGITNQCDGPAIGAKTPTKNLTPEMIAEQFALSAPIGTPCLYYPTKPFDRAKAVATKIRSAPWVLGHGAIVVAVEGMTGGKSIEHIAFAPPPCRSEELS